MKRAAWVGLVGLALLGTHSFVYACDHSAKKTAVTKVPSCDARVVLAKPVGGCKPVDLPMTFAFEVDGPQGASPRLLHLVAERQPESRHPVVRTARAALALGRAIRTTVEAVMGTLVSAAAERTAAIV
jgi:hypothetical protein